MYRFEESCSYVQVFLGRPQVRKEESWHRSAAYRTKTSGSLKPDGPGR
jgi:hypothetical protein